MVELPALENRNQYPSPGERSDSDMYPSLKEYNVPSIDSGNRIAYEASSTTRGNPTRFQSIWKSIVKIGKQLVVSW